MDDPCDDRAELRYSRGVGRGEGSPQLSRVLPPCAGSSATTMAARVRWCDACDEQSGYSDVKNGAGTQGEHLTDQQMSGRS